MTDQNTHIETSFLMRAPVYQGWQIGGNETVMLNRITGKVYAVIEG